MHTGSIAMHVRLLAIWETQNWAQMGLEGR